MSLDMVGNKVDGRQVGAMTWGTIKKGCYFVT